MVWQLTKIGFLDLTPEKYDICILIDIVNGGDTGKVSAINHSPPFHRFFSPVNTTKWHNCLK
jgi:hypothetical protein